ncbi:DUF4145 domain-containing protein [Serratia plymuthica]|uniref:DUF4145 domain-containing protein n=1 Tax=Serratia plymuthica S13 TaxID=1348660 RepID=S4YP83_SERPL|nr:DUF4145 domain-containing protein [Serratia plymuthica]AGP47092.1 hypothetical protein M621_15375 [Serratia plymuthica S13]KYG13983.1 hypothetical protein SOD10_50090 [Serratia plymuthica]MBL3525079.1 DUF4145 domain-containing protein [Serratia plymuthica]QQT80950.1 DUF4145 domain-containing protein [Serratia plymuthica]
MSGASLYTMFLEDKIPHWRCPGCLNETLEIVPGSFHKEATSKTTQHQTAVWFEPEEHYTMVFSCLLRCSRKVCQEAVAITGEGWVENDFNEANEEYEYIELFRAKYFYPPLPIFILPENCPEPICRQLNEISALLAAHPSAAVNTMRTALEMLLDELGVPREIARVGKSSVILTLHKRIDDYPAIIGGYSAAFMALKWLGNRGSHTDEPIKQSHIVGACTVLDDLIQQIYPQKSNVPTIVAELNQAYAPPAKPGCQP